MTTTRSTILVPMLAVASSVLWACDGDRQDTMPGDEETGTAQSEAPATLGGQDATLPGLESLDRARAYVASVGDGVISEIDLVDNEVAWTLRVSEGTDTRSAESAMGIAASPDGQWIYTGDAARDELVIVDGDAREIVARIPLSHQVHGIDIGPRGDLLWISGQHPDYSWLSSTTIINPHEHTVVRTFTPGLGNDAHYAFTPDAAEVWGASVTTNAESADMSPEAQLGLMGYNEVAIAPNGARAYVVGPESGTVYAVDVGARAALDHVRVGERTQGVAVIDVLTRELLGRIEMGTDPHEISLEDYYVRPTDGQRVTPERGAPQGADTSAEGAPSPDIGTRAESRAAGITVEASLTSIEPQPSGGQALPFAVVLDTHAGDLMEVDLARQVSVEVDGAPADAAARWTGDSESAHHRNGTLHLSLDISPTRDVTLIFHDVGVEERTLSFDVSGAQRR